MTSYICSYCNKSYLRKSAFNNHQLKCELIRICNNIKSKSEQDDDIDYIEEFPIKFNGSINDMYKLLINLNNKFEKLEADYSEIKKYVNVTKNKIDIIQYLNINYDCSDFDFIKFLNSIQITNIELEKVFEKTRKNIQTNSQTLMKSIQKSSGNRPKTFPNQSRAQFLGGLESSWALFGAKVTPAPDF